jgi:hypothetical protein
MLLWEDYLPYDELILPTRHFLGSLAVLLFVIATLNEATGANVAVHWKLAQADPCHLPTR